MPGAQSVSFRGCSWLMIYHLGVLQALREAFDTASWRFAGASSGSLTAALAVADVPAEAACEWIFRLAEESRRYRLGPAGRMTSYVRRGLDDVLPPDADRRASGRLRISITRLRGWRNWLVDEFHSRTDLIDAILASCYIPLYYERPTRFRGRWCVDGGLTENIPKYAGATITVSPRPGAFDICPPSPVPRIESYLPGSTERLAELFAAGRRDGAQWAARQDC